MAMEPLPSHRQMITALIRSVSNIAPSISPDIISPTQPPRAAQPPTLSPLQAIPTSQRPLLLTLHVLFPNLLLPALDLLDRGLVTRLVRNQELQDGSSSDKIKNDVFLVRSLATTLSRRARDFGLSTSKRYVVHLSAWNCSCGSFTVDAFPSHHVNTTDQVRQLPSQEEEWTFGGFGSDSQGDTPPCCKHLLACLLVDKWPMMLGMYVEDRAVSRDDMAGIVADL
ncbi:hypothetical protein DER45DRAFT_67882 [Fusarium avenaceum]|nr:hypothetical protein DER45DRAFT_67882 [Fusarium avenaceum]